MILYSYIKILNGYIASNFREMGRKKLWAPDPPGSLVTDISPWSKAVVWPNKSATSRHVTLAMCLPPHYSTNHLQFDFHYNFTCIVFQSLLWWELSEFWSHYLSYLCCEKPYRILKCLLLPPFGFWWEIRTF